MFIIWRGYGFAVVLITLAVVALLCLPFSPEFAGTYGYPLGLMISGVISYLWGKKLAEDKGQLVVDPQTGEQILLKNPHDLYYIPMHICGIIIFVIGVVCLIKEVAGL